METQADTALASVQAFNQCVESWEKEGDLTATFLMVLFGVRAKAFWLAKPVATMNDMKSIAVIEELMHVENTFEILLQRKFSQVIEEFQWVKRKDNMQHWMEEVSGLPSRMKELSEGRFNLNEVALKLKKIEKLWRAWLELSWLAYSPPALLKENPVFLIWLRRFDDIDAVFYNNHQMFSADNQRDFFNQLRDEAGNPPFWWLESK